MWREHQKGKNGGVDANSDCDMKRPFKCAYCHHTSGLSGNVRKHVKSAHPGLPIEYVDLRKVLQKAVKQGREVEAESNDAIQCEVTQDDERMALFQKLAYSSSR